jgi:hypothetical protein
MVSSVGNGGIDPGWAIGLKLAASMLDDGGIDDAEWIVDWGGISGRHVMGRGIRGLDVGHHGFGGYLAPPTRSLSHVFLAGRRQRTRVWKELGVLAPVEGSHLPMGRRRCLEQIARRREV